MSRPDRKIRTMTFHLRTMDAALKMVESLVSQGAQCAIAPEGEGYSISAPDRTGWAPPPAQGVPA